MPQFNAPGSSKHAAITATLGSFVFLWSMLEQILDVAVMKQLNIDPERAVIVASNLPFERKVSIVRSLLHLHDPKFSPL